ncbi:hypothetical protein Pcar_0858 [Syntrophotalea carbinolica DSM 2380]|uniref:Uncharacterized protein n=1 Tax=Syntrophotalea carbinolica (strain DSM 2380 / NBRC 103641 / GraBd1) TaxID=338963 RepID=Q3A694_SYNC1|nr:hypothetical protein [Syntrophotalea carbinolica]ABA88113.1 hypothetical protein Pcar_0858 [Syntrophotalea carbinolica DSM 2380]
MVNRFGTTSDMIIQEIDDNGITRLVAIDSKGLYLTTRDRVDKVLADVNRYGVNREEFYQQMQGLGLKPHEVFSANKHLIKSIPVREAAGKAVNPLKASKRGL